MYADGTARVLLSPFGFSVTVEVEECDDEGGGICEEWADDDGGSATEGDDGSSSSGFAMRSPPKYVSVRLMSPFMAAGASAGRKKASGDGRCRSVVWRPQESEVA